MAQPWNDRRRKNHDCHLRHCGKHPQGALLGKARALDFAALEEARWHRRAAARSARLSDAVFRSAGNAGHTWSPGVRARGGSAADRRDRPVRGLRRRPPGIQRRPRGDERPRHTLEEPVRLGRDPEAIRCPFGPLNARRVARRAGAPCGDPPARRPKRPFVGTHQDELPAKSERWGEKRSITMNTTHHATVSPVDDAPMADSIREIIVFVDGEIEPTGILEFAGVLALEYGAHLTGVFMRPAPAVTPPEMFARGEGIPNVIGARQAEVEETEANHRARFDGIVRRYALGWEWRSEPYFSSDGGIHARYADLAVVARPDPAGQAP